MQHAPPVTYPLGRSNVAGGLMLVLWLSGIAATGSWAWHADAPGWRQALALSVAIGAGLWAGWGWYRTPAGVLTWDGKDWLKPSAEHAFADRSSTQAGGSVRARLDLQSVLLVSWHGDAGSRAPGQWLWLVRSSQPERWGDVRRAVYSRAIPGASPPSRPSPPPTAKT